MNQILIYKNLTNKKREKHFYRFLFIFSIIILLFLLSYYSIHLYANFRSNTYSPNMYSTFYSKSLFASRLSTNIEPKVEMAVNFSIIGMIEIKRIDLVDPILSKTDDDLLQIAPCKYYGADINEVGNCCIVGHNLNNDLFFGRLKELKIGDTINLYSQNGNMLEYTVSDKYEVTKDDTTCLSQDTSGEIMLTLITCNNWNGKRLIIKAIA